MLRAERACETRRRLNERVARPGIARRRPRVDAERQRGKRVTEEPAAHFRERQHADQLPPALRDEVMATVIEYIFDDVAPADSMEESRLWAGFHEGFPAARIGVRERPNGDALGRPLDACDVCRGGVHQPSSPRKTRSARSHRKSASRRRSLGSIRCRFR